MSFLSFLHLDIVVPAALGALAGGITVLKVIAPRTKTTVDDDVLKRLEQLEAIIAQLPVPKG
jgi:hypothetical protein